MRNILIAASLLVLLGTAMAEVANRLSATPAAAHALLPQKHAAAANVDSSRAGIRSVSVPRDARGHFQTDGRIDGQRIGFMIDTGASVIALNESSAARIGVRPSRADYTSTVSTANGTVKAARTRIALVDVGGLLVRDVDALVLPDEALSENLLGLSFLSKLKRFEYTNGQLVLEQ
jgi:aspartyl protease family protein